MTGEHRGDRERREGFRRAAQLAEPLMARRPEPHFDDIQKNARFARDLDV